MGTGMDPRVKPGDDEKGMDPRTRGDDEKAMDPRFREDDAIPVTPD